MKPTRFFVQMLAGCTISALCVAPAFATLHPHERHGFMIGFGLGGGSAGIKDVGERKGGGTGNFRIGYAVRPDLVLAFEGAAWSKTVREGVDDVTWTFSTGAAALTYFPSNTGVFIRGGLGFGTASAQIVENNVRVSADKTGLGLVVAGGYEWRLTKKFAIGPQVEFTYQHEGGAIESTNVIGGGLNLNWYW